jgi:hypothetical protein
MINPNDPVVTILQKAVTELRSELKGETEEIGEAMQHLAQGLGQMIARLSSRISVLEGQCLTKSDPSRDPNEGSPAQSQGGVEL